MNRPVYARLLVIVLLAMLIHPATAATQPNIVLIMSDYMGYHDSEPYGATDVRTPQLSRLASAGVRMTNFYAAAPVCGPARAALYTGQYPARIGFEKNIRSAADGLSASIPSLPRWLHDAGYRTALFGKWHLGSGEGFTPNEHGFDEFFGHHQWTIGYYNHKTQEGEPGLYENGHVVECDGYLTDLLTDAAVAFIEQNQDHPFFLTLSYNAALPPYQPPGWPESKWNDGWDVNKATREDYVRMVERMDVGIGKVLDSLDERRLTDNTLVIYLYDHGGRHLVNSSPLFHGFATLWEGGIRIPLIMRLPGRIPANAVSDSPGIAMDITATILDLADLDSRAATLDGDSLMPGLHGETRAAEKLLYWRSDLYNFGEKKAVRGGRFKYLEDGNTQFLFDLDADSGERNNLFSQFPAEVNRLRAALRDWEESMQTD